MMMKPTEDSWFTSPCFSCLESPCCTTLPIYSPVIETRSDLYYALRLLDYQGIELGLYDSGKWMVYWKRPCRFLDRRSSKCLIHNTPQQPRLCADYGPHQCWYRNVFARGDSKRFLRFDRQRFLRILVLVTYHPSGEIDGVPDWERMIDALAPFPIDSGQSGTCCSDEPAENSGVRGRFIDPCRSLLFPMALPKIRSDVDLLRFRLGFPGVESGLREGMGVIRVHAPCRYLCGTRCLLGRDHDCAVAFQANHPSVSPGHSGIFRPAGSANCPGPPMIGLEQMEDLMSRLYFDEKGRILDPSTSVS